MKLQVSYLLAVMTAFISCKTKDKKLASDYPYTLKQSHIISFPLDTTQGFYYNCVRYDSIANTFVLFNEYNNTIYTYEYDTQKLLSKKVLEKEGPDGIGNASRAGFLIQADTMYLLNYRAAKLFVFVKDKITRTFELYPKQFESEGFPEATTLYPMYKINNKIFLITQSLDPREDNTKLNNLLTVDLKTGEITRAIKRPEFYNKGYWGMFNPYRVYHAYNEKTGKEVFSFCADQKLHVYDTLQNKVTEVETTTDYFDNTEIKPIEGVTASQGQKFLNEHKDEANMHDFISPSFGPFFYDQYRDVYYRFVNHPLTEDEYRDRQMFEKYPMEFSIIILNNQFEKIGEFLLPRFGFYSGMMLVTKDGLLIAESALYKRNENLLPFAVFKLEKNETK
jgi:hypothetical protein